MPPTFLRMASPMGYIILAVYLTGSTPDATALFVYKDIWKERKDPKKVFAVGLSLTLAVTLGFGGCRFSLAEESTGVYHSEELSLSDYITEDSQELFQNYVNQMFSVKKSNTVRKVPRKKKLTGNNAVIYSYIADAVEKIANGELESTKIVVPPSSLDDSQDITFDDVSKVIQSVLADLPQYMYWADVTKGYSCMVGAGTANVSFKVNTYFSKNGATYTVDTSKTGAAKKAVENAKQIVENHANDTDYEKLVDYKEEICDLVSYDYDAASKTSSQGYQKNNNPWQIIYVFDGDTSTDVVCEGYAKAFKYLCDLSTFSSSKIEVNIVDGKLYQGTSSKDKSNGGGGHMWNLVTMENGKNYLVDVTNCDNDTVGYPDKLFMVGTEAPSTADVNGYSICCDEGEYAIYDYSNRSQYASVFTDAELTLAKYNYSHRSQESEIEPEETEPMTEPETPQETKPTTEQETPQETEPTTEPETPQETVPTTEPETPQETEPATEPETPQETEPATEPETPQETKAVTEPTTIPETSSEEETKSTDTTSKKPEVVVTDPMIYTDVPSSKWYFDKIKYVYERGLMTGKSSKAFDPDGTLTRAETVQVLYAAVGKPEVDYLYTGFPDVSGTDWFAKAVVWANTNGIAHGKGNGFDPNGKVTRQELALMLKNFAALEGGDSTSSVSLSEFSDEGSISSWARDAVEWAHAVGVINGKGTNIAPADSATRAEYATMIKGLYENAI